MASNELDITEAIGDWLGRVGQNVKDHFEEYDIDRATVSFRISLAITMIVAFVIRLYPLLIGWDPLIKAFDPWMQLRAAQYILDHGFWNYLGWYDYMGWYPYGREVGASLYIGVPLMVVLVYTIITTLGFHVTLIEAAFFMPVIFGTLGVYFTYLLGKELISKRAGLFAAIIMSVTPSYLSRSIGGFVDNESIGVLWMVMTFYFFARAFLRDSNKSGIMAGISMFFMASSWGAFRFAYDLFPLVALVMIITGKFTARFMKAYLTAISISTLLMILVPRVGGKFLADTEGIVPIGFIAFMVLFGILQNMSKRLTPEGFRSVIVIGFLTLVAVLGTLFIILLSTGTVANVGNKFISVIIPTNRNKLPLIDSVSEHLPLAWGSLYANLSTLVFFIPLGVYFALKQPTEKNVFILTFALTTIYFSGSMVRLMLLLAPSASILTALAIDNLLLPFAYAAHGRIKLTKITMEMKTIGGPNAFGSYLMVFILIAIMLGAGVSAAGTRFSTPEITPGNSPDSALTDWLQAIEWMQRNTAYDNYLNNPNEALKAGPPPVMLSWWDYGNYITSPGHTISLIDNATFNSTQIGVGGTMLMYNVSTALPLMYKYDVSYVLVVPAGGVLNYGSDVGKSIWMIRISEQYTKQYGIKEADYFRQASATQQGGYFGKYYESVLWRLMAYQAPDMSTSAGSNGQPPFITSQGADLTSLAPDFRANAVKHLDYFTEVFRSTGVGQTGQGLYPFIRIYKVNYPSDIEQRVNEFDMTMARAQAQVDK